MPLRGVPHAHHDLGQLGLAVALDAGDAEHLAAVDPQRDVVEQPPAGGVLERDVGELEHLLVGDRRLLGVRGGQLGADHQLGELAGGDVGGAYGGHGGAAADDGDVVGDGEHLVELVRDEDERVALLLELPEVREERVHLLRHQHRRRLVEDDHLGAAVEDLEDLHPLALADAEPLDELVGVEAEAVGRGDLLDLGAGLVPDAVELLGAEHDVLEHGEVVGEHEVLEDHADAELDGVGGRAHRGRCAVDLDRAVVGLLHAVQDLHERRLAGAVLPHDRVHRAGPHVDVDVVVGDDAREALPDASQPDGELLGAGRGGRCWSLSW